MRYPLWELLAPPSRFGVPRRTAVRAEGTKVLYADGEWKLCVTSGLWNVNLGYNNRAVADAIHASLLDASYLPLFRSGHEPALAAARALLEVAGPAHYGRVLFSTSGSAANDMMMKLARQYWALQGEPQRRLIVGLKGSYHGLTYGSHALTGEPLNQADYSVDTSLVRHVDRSSDAELRALLAEAGDRVAAVVMEPVLGTGAYPVSQSLLSALDELRREHGFLLVADEVATGFGRTGSFFASENWPARPDLLIASKGLTNGTCAAAVILASHGVCDVYERTDAILMQGETQAGAPSTCAAILATIAEFERLDALKRAGIVASQLDTVLADLADHPLVVGDGGLGCFRALRLGGADGPLPFPALLTVLNSIREAGAVVQPGPSCAQLVPTLVYESEDIEQLAAALRQGLDKAAEILS